MALSDEINKLRERAAAAPSATPPPADTPPADTPPADPPPADTPPADTPPPAAPDRLSVIGEAFGRTFKDDDEFTEWKTGIESFTTRESQLLQQIEEYEAGLDDSKLYPNEQFRTLAKLMIAHPGKNPVAVTEMLSLDGKAYIDNPVNVLALSLMLDNPEIYPTKEAAESVIARKHQLVKDENDKWEVDDATLRDLQTEAKTATGRFDELRKTVPAGEKVDLASKRNEKLQAEQARINKITEASKTLFSKTIPAALKAIEIPVTVKGEDGKEATEIAFSYSIPEAFVKSKAAQAVIETFRQDRIRNAADWTPELEATTLQEATEYLSAMYMYRNRTEIYKALADDLGVKFKDEAWMKRHNVRPLRTDGTTHTPTTDQVAEQQNLKEAAKRIGINY